MDGALDAVFARPSHHLARGRAVLDAAEADFAEQLYAGGGEFLEIVLDHFVFDHGRAGMDLHAAGAQRPERASQKLLCLTDGVQSIWVADITYVHLARAFAYLAVILDAFSRKAVGWAF